jgi:3-oxoacyl-[acyl-carrier-protein] synthase II
MQSASRSWLIRSGRADAMLAGGSDSAISPVVLAGYRNLGALASLRHGAEGASRPFDAERDGFVIGEGSGVLALEEREHALARGRASTPSWPATARVATPRI